MNRRSDPIRLGERAFDNRFRHGKCHFELAETNRAEAGISGARFEKATFDEEIGPEIVLRLTDSTPFAYELKREAFALSLKSGVAQTSVGPVLFLLWWIPPVTDGKPFALYEQILNPTHAGTLEGLRLIARQTHLHIVLIGPAQELVDVYEFENTFGLEKLISVSESACKEYCNMDFIAAKQEYDVTYDLTELFGTSEAGVQEQVDADIIIAKSASPPENRSIGSDAPVSAQIKVSPSGPEMVMDWEEVKGAAQAAFSVWECGGELEWAKDVWDRAVAAGIASYSNEMERHRVAVLFLGLAGLYRDYCALAWEERDAPTYSYWAEHLSLDDFVLGQLVGPDRRIGKKDALNHLVNAARPQVVRLLMHLFGDINSLFVSLWKAGPDSQNERDDDCNADERLTDGEILSDATPEKVAAYCWLDSGAEILLDPF